MNETGALINKIAKEIGEVVENLGTEECEMCKKTFTNYAGKCRAYSWSISFHKGIWDFSLIRHTEEIWHKTIMEGSIADILLKAFKGLCSGEWKKIREP